MVDRVKAALADQLSVKGETIQLALAQAVIWPDASLGCPRPGTDYIQVQTPGFVISLQAGGETYLFHTDQTSNYVLCPAGEGPFPEIPVTPSGIQDGVPWLPVN